MPYHSFYKKNYLMYVIYLFIYIYIYIHADSNSYIHISGKGTTIGGDYFNASFVDVS